MLRGHEHGGGIRLTTTAYGSGYTPIHPCLHGSGSADALRRLLGRIQTERLDVIQRFVGTVPTWLLTPCFREACAQTTVRDAFEYARRFRRLRIFIETRIASEDEGVPHWMIRSDNTSIFGAVAMARLSFGSAMESFAAACAAAIAPANALP